MSKYKEILEELINNLLEIEKQAREEICKTEKLLISFEEFLTFTSLVHGAKGRMQGQEIFDKKMQEEDGENE